MTQTARQQRRAWRTLALGVAAIGALILSVWIVGVRSEQSTRDVLERQHSQRIAGCVRSVERDFEAVSANEDLGDIGDVLATFAADAAEARRADGNEKKARSYMKSSRRAEAIIERVKGRIDSIKTRLPERNDVASANEFCRLLYPG